MPLLLLIFFGLYGWFEFEVFILIGNAIGGLVTFLGIFVTAFIGVALMKRQRRINNTTLANQSQQRRNKHINARKRNFSDTRCRFDVVARLYH